MITKDINGVTTTGAYDVFIAVLLEREIAAAVKSIIPEGCYYGRCIPIQSMLLPTGSQMIIKPGDPDSVHVLDQDFNLLVTYYFAA